MPPQKLVLVPLVEWEKIKGKNSDKKQVVTVNSAALKKAVSHPQKDILRLKEDGRSDRSLREAPNLKLVKNQKGSGKLLRSKETLDRQLEWYRPLKKRRAFSLLSFMKKNKDIQWNEKGEFIYKKKRIPKSDIRKLINHAVQNTKDVHIGMHTFYKALSNSNIPEFLVGNKKGRELMKKYSKQKDDSFRPPGRLNRRLKRR